MKWEFVRQHLHSERQGQVCTCLCMSRDSTVAAIVNEGRLNMYRTLVKLYSLTTKSLTETVKREPHQY